MGCAQSTTNEDPKSENEAKNEVGSSSSSSSLIAASEICRKMVWSLILLRGGRRRRREKRENEGGGGGGDEEENNKAWLLGESGFGFGGGEVSGDPQSSFRFSFGSQVEMESISLNSAATVLLVNLEKGGCGDGDGDGDGDGNGGSESSKWRRMESLERSVSPVAGMLLRFSFSEIRSASRDFSKGRVLGRGALSCVYRGQLGFGRAVAIKRLDNEDKECAKAFCRELTIACSLHHPNVVPLLGFCIDPQGLFLVYKYVSGGSLGHHLHEKKKGRRHSSLSWSVRYKVAIGVAQAVAYLHDGTDRCIVHRDIKPSNILLSSKNTPKLCDFGLATWTPAPSIPFLCKTVKGTFGYLAPEYFQHGKVSDKMDVYAFGVVLLELITGRKPIETRREENLVLWARPLLQREGVAGELIDPQIEHGSYNWSQMSRMVRAAAACINNDDSQRPSINQVITMLQGEEEQCKRGSVAARNGCVVQTKNDMKSHMALAMLGVSDLDEDDLHCR